MQIAGIIVSLHLCTLSNMKRWSSCLVTLEYLLAVWKYRMLHTHESHL